MKKKVVVSLAGDRRIAQPAQVCDTIGEYVHLFNTTMRVFCFIAPAQTITEAKLYLTSLPPGFNLDIGKFFSSEILIDSTNQALFSAFLPTTGTSKTELTVRLNTSPGYSSVNGLTDEHGVWTWHRGRVD